MGSEAIRVLTSVINGKAMNNPLGGFTNIVAAVISVLIVTAWVASELMTMLGITVNNNPGNLFAAATAVLGYVFGSHAAAATAEKINSAVTTTIIPLAATTLLIGLILLTG